MFKLSAALALLALTQASLAAISPTNPIAGTVWKQGSKATISWTATGTDATADVPIQLVHGDATALQPVTTIVDSVLGSTGKYSWTVPADMPDGADYAVAFGSAPTYYYSHYFTIGKAVANASSSAGAPSASAPLSTALPSLLTTAAPSHSASASMNASASASASAATPTSAGARSAAVAVALPAVAAIAAVAAFM
ncbi:hypothetical protein Unana1_04232 [Umbelopsis nana]